MRGPINVRELQKGFRRETVCRRWPIDLGLEWVSVRLETVRARNQARAAADRDATRAAGTHAGTARRERVVAIDCRLIAASEADLAARAPEGDFRADLLNRLNVAQIELPPLRDGR